MAAEAPFLGQLQHTSSHIVPSCSSGEPRPPAFPDPLQGLVRPPASSSDPLQGLVQEMALSAVIQKHASSSSSSTVPSTTNSTYHNGPIMKNYMVPAQASTSVSLAAPPSAELLGMSSTPSPVPPQGAAGVMGMQQGFIAFSGAQGNGNVSLLPHPQATPIIQGTPLQLSGQLHDAASTAAPTANVVQLTPVCCYEGTSNAQPSPVVERSALLHSNHLVG